MKPKSSKLTAQPVTAFVLAGGGSLGAVQVGMLKALIGEGIVPDMVIGASVGAINGAWLAGKPDTQGIAMLEDIWLGLSRQQIFPLSVSGLMSGVFQHRNYLVSPRNLSRLINDSLPYRHLEDSQVPFHVVATDLFMGEPVTLSSGPVTKALLASAAIPAVFPPVHLNGRVLVDGGIASNTPVRTALDLGATRIIALPTGLSCALKKPPTSILGMAMHALNLLIVKQLHADGLALQHETELIIVPPLCPVEVGAHDFSQTRQLITLAEKETAKWLKSGGLDITGLDMLNGHKH